MRVNTNGKRNVSLDFDAPKKFKLADEQGREVPYIRTGANSFRLSGNIPEFVDLNEVIEQPKPQPIVKPMQLQAQQMALVNTNDVLVLNQVAQQLEIEQNLLAETQKQSQLTQEYLDVQQGNINNAIADVNALETNNAERLTAVESGLVNTSAVIDNTRALLYASDMEIAQSIDEHKNANNPHNITKKTIGLDKVDNTSDMDKPVSKAVALALEEKADKTELQDVKDELLKYQEKNEKINNALSQYTGGIGGNELPSGGVEGQVLIKKSDQEGDVAWGNAAGIERHNILGGRSENDAHPISAITDLQDVLDGKQEVGDYATNTALTQGLETKQDVIGDLDTIRANANLVSTKQDTLVSGTNIKTLNNESLLGEGNIDITSAQWGNITGDITAQTDLQTALDGKQDIISDLETIRENAQDGKDIIPQVNVNTQRIEDLTTAKFPNVVIVGTPHIEGGQVSNYSDTSYLQFPFVDISRGQPFDIYFSFTTAQDVTTQQNILDAYFGIALAIQNGKGIMALSSNGTSWDIGTSVGTNTLLPNTTYYVKYSWTGTEYSAALSTDDQTYVPDMNIASTLSPHKTTIFIGGSPNIFGAGSAHPFKGTINFNKSKVVVNGITVWEGMADVGLASRANVSLNNLDEVGEGRFNAKQDVITDLATIRDGASKGATALQSFTETDPTVPSYVKSITQANITDWNNKQDLLVSGTNIKTIGGESLLGSGDIEVSSYHPSLLSFQWTDHIINEMSWLRADTFSWQSGDVYTSVYNELETEVNKGTYIPATEIELAHVKTPKGYKIIVHSQSYDAESQVINQFNQTGVAWYYILDVENRRFKLPRTRYGFTGLRDSVGNYVPESLPNISGRFTGLLNHINFQGDGAFVSTKADDYISGYINDTGNYNSNIQNTFLDASRSSSAYKDNAPVQQRAIQMYLYFYVGEFSQTATEQTAGITTEVLNTKADISASNFNSQGKSLISGLGMPSNRYIDLTLGASGATYTAPANGWFVFGKRCSAVGQYFNAIYVSPLLSNFWSDDGGAIVGNICGQLVPVTKGQIVKINYNTGGDTTVCRFIYAEGEKNV